VLSDIDRYVENDGCGLSYYNFKALLTIHISIPDPPGFDTIECWECL
jgi:hypothetical protein